MTRPDQRSRPVLPPPALMPFLDALADLLAEAALRDLQGTATAVNSGGAR